MNVSTIKYYALFFLPCILSSTLILPETFSPYRLPLYVVSILFSIILVKTQNNRIQNILYSLALTLLFSAIISGFFVTDSQFAINIRQWILYCTLYWCAQIGSLFYKVLSRKSIGYANQILWIFVLLFAYGIYTYYAQVYHLPEFLSVLRPNPNLTVDNIYNQDFVGWDSSARAYSVWFEPSFSTIVLACTLPLLYLATDSKVKFYFITFSVLYGYLTFSRSVWIILLFFAFGHLTGFFRIRIAQIWLLTVAIFMSVALTVIQIIFSSFYHETSSIIRIVSVVRAIVEWVNSPVLGTGQAELLRSTDALSGVLHIHASIPALLHWYGILGLIISIIPFWHLSKMGGGQGKLAQTSFIYLSIIAITIGGALMMMSIFWFFWGFYMAHKFDKHI